MKRKEFLLTTTVIGNVNQYVSSYLSRKSTEKRKPEVAKSEGEVLIEKILEELAHSEVGPPSMD
jgi:hypothetical protein